MRIIGGQFKGRTLKTPSNLKLRPTTDFAKEGLFNVLDNHIDFEGITALDLFAGTAGISIELASRGADHITAVELHKTNFAFIKKACHTLFPQVITCLNADVFKYLQSTKHAYDLIFADPPYELETVMIIPGIVFDKQLLKLGGILIVEHDDSKNFSGIINHWQTRKYGKVHFSFFKNPN